MGWEVKIKYGANAFTLQAEKVYESEQIMRIKVYGKHSYILLENDYPFLQATKSKKAIKWKVKEGDFISKNRKQDAELVVDIIYRLEDLIKNKKPYAYGEYLRGKT